MLDKNKYTSPCLFSEQVISYLYKEIGAQETNDFEAHLKSCPICSEELSGFGAVRSSIGEWRRKEFSVLETPAFNFLPDHTEKVHIAPVSTEKNWWLALKESLSTPSPVWAASAFAALVVCVGLAFVIFNYSKYVEVTENSFGENTNAVSPVVETKNEINTHIVPSSNLIEKSSETIVKVLQSEQDSESASQKVAPPRNAVLKVSNNSNVPANRNKSVPINRKQATSKEVKQMPLSKPKNIPLLADIEDVEDDSLRLADLFDETDAR